MKFCLRCFEKLNILKSLFFIILMTITTNGLFAEKPNNKAMIGFFRFLNETGKKDLDYLSSSITDIIEKNMSENFIFAAPNKERNQKIADLLLLTSKNFNEPDLKALCATATIDYAIFGKIAKASETEFVQEIRRYVEEKNKRKKQTDCELIIKEKPKPEQLAEASSSFFGKRYPDSFDAKDTRDPLASFYIQGFGYGIAGSLNGEYQFGRYFLAGAGAGFFSGTETTYTIASTFLGARYHGVLLRTGPTFIFGKDFSLTGYASLGYEFVFYESFFLEPAAMVLASGNAMYPYAAINFGYRF